MMSLVTTQFVILFLKLMIDDFVPINSQLLNFLSIINQLPQSFFYLLNTLRLVSYFLSRLFQTKKGNRRDSKVQYYLLYSSQLWRMPISLVSSQVHIFIVTALFLPTIVVCGIIISVLLIIQGRWPYFVDIRNYFPQ